MIRRLVKRMLMIWQVFCRRDCSPKIVFYHDVGTRYTSMGTPSALFWKHMGNLGPHGVAFDAMPFAKRETGNAIRYELSLAQDWSSVFRNEVTA